LALLLGSRLGPYEIQSAIGAGGMGEVYRARDTKLQRDVAIKVLPDALARDRDRLTRLEREARALASLNHHNIAQVHGLEDSSGILAVVMELVEGPTLAERIAEGPIPLDEAMPIARQIADALEAAHEHGIIHRDLKPANVKVRADGTVKVLDFGLAKSIDSIDVPSDISASPTITTPAVTRAGIILGTAPYMSPEQARGKSVDKRADIWAFGCVVFEMVSGRQAFPAGDVMETLAAVLTKEPDWAALPPHTPSGVQRLLRRCLQKDPRKRLRDIADARVEIDDLASMPAGPSAPGEAPPRRLWWRIATAAIAGLAFGIFAAVAARGVGSSPTPQPVKQFVVGTPTTEPLVSFPIAALRAERDVAISPDGQHVIYVADVLAAQNAFSGNRGFHLYARALDRLEGMSLTPPQSQPVANPFVSGDGLWVGYASSESPAPQSPVTWTLKKVPIRGGPSQTLFTLNDAPRGATWGDDGQIVLATAKAGSGLFRGSASGGSLQALTTPDIQRGELNHWWPEILPGGQAILFTIVRGRGASGMDVALFNVRSRQQTTLIPGCSDPHYASNGYIVCNADGSLRAARFDLDRLTVTGDSVEVLKGVVNLSAGAAEFGLARDGTLMYRAAVAADTGVALAYVDRAGREEPLTAPVRPYVEPAVSPDGTRVVVRVLDPVNSDLFIWNLPRGPMTRLTSGPTTEGAPLWTRDGRSIVFNNGDGKLVLVPADNTSGAEVLNTGTTRVSGMSWSKGGDLVFHEFVDAASSWDIGELTLNPRSKNMLLTGPAGDARPAVSPDGRWLAYESTESGQLEVYVRPFPNVREWRVPISTHGGAQPRWAADGKELYFIDSESLMAARIETTPMFRVAGPPQRLFGLENYAGAGFAAWRFNATRDGRFIVTTRASPRDSHQLILVERWVDELKRQGR
jgi:serine/threonine protein kinase